MTSQAIIPPAPTTLSRSVSPVRIGIIVGSTRPGRKAELVARWVHEVATRRNDARFEVLDIADFGLPLLDEPMPPMSGQVNHPHTNAWAAAVDACDGFVFVTPEYNHSTSAALKNAIDFLFAEWNDKACGFVSYGVDGGVRAVEHLRAIVGEVKLADVRNQVALNLATIGVDEVHADHRTQQRLSTMLDETVAWGMALRQLRAATVVG
ncbi:MULTISPECIES: NADPH-dependent FMN reductase [Micrococcales]|uniref:NADPH-dependent FMN reductase n=1 Tax=Micrococcales TaxID=85006 RepID=UPI003F9587B3